MSKVRFTADDFKGATPITLKRGTCLIYEGDVQEQYAYFIVSGKTDIQTECYDGTQTLLYTLTSGALFGELRLMGAQARTASVYTTEKSELLKISPVLWKKRMQNMDFLRRVHEMQLQRYLETTKAASRLGQSTVLHRLGTYLMTLPDWHQSQGGVIHVMLPSHGQLGRMLNCTRERITVVMKQFYQAGAVKKEDSGYSLITHVSLMNLLN
ncbi:MAG: Crp/Fnr family transcriptional regulator [Mariprofundaceae bacterium]|nr:Crp/Fnr family transcriptional regulator [Mariprofundaceae bacterium]